MAAKKKTSAMTKVGKAAKTVMKKADEYVVAPIGKALGLTGKKKTAKKPAAKKASAAKKTTGPAKKTTAKKSGAKKGATRSK